MATIYDVARAAGVSPKTVSRVLNGDAPVNENTKAAVNEAMRLLNYIPSNAARSMRRQKSGLIGMITGAISMGPRWTDPAGLPDIFIVQGAQRYISEQGRTLLISDTGGDPRRVPELIQTFLEHRVEGLIYVADFHRQVELPRISRSTPLVLANCIDEAGTPTVVPDDTGGQGALVSGLIERGHRHIGFLTLPDGYVAQGLRLEGYIKALEKHRLPYDPRLVATGALADPNHEFDILWDALDKMLALDNPPSVICCANDKMAMRVYTILRQRGLRIPDDISVAGYDDYRIITEHLHPTLTTVDLPYGAMGVRAAEKLLRLIAGTPQPAEQVRETVSGPVIWRDSVKSRDLNVTSILERRRPT